MPDQNIPVTADGNVQIDCDNDNNSGDNFIDFTHDNGTPLMRIQEDGNVGIGRTDPDATLDVAGPIRQSGPRPTTILYHGTNEAGIPTGDGFRMRYENDFFGTDNDALVIEKTDGNHDVVDGGIAFVNTNQHGEVETAMSIRGINGNIEGGEIGINGTLNRIYMVPPPSQLPFPDNAEANRENIRDAIEAANRNGGGIVLLQRGTYEVNVEPNEDYAIMVRAGISLIGAGARATIIDGSNCNAHVIVTDPAIYNEETGGWRVTYNIVMKDFKVIGQRVDDIYTYEHTGIYLQGVEQSILENVRVDGCKTGIHLKGWVNTILNCWVQQCYTGYDLSWHDPDHPDATNAASLRGCHYEGGIEPATSNIMTAEYDPPSGRVTVVTTNNHNLHDGDEVSISGCTLNTSYNGEYRDVIVENDTRFTADPIDFEPSGPPVAGEGRVTGKERFNPPASNIMTAVYDPASDRVSVLVQPAENHRLQNGGEVTISGCTVNPSYNGEYRDVIVEDERNFTAVPVFDLKPTGIVDGEGIVTGRIIGAYVYGNMNAFLGCTIEKRHNNAHKILDETIGILLKYRIATFISGCYFEGWKTTFLLDFSQGVNTIGNYYSHHGTGDGIVYREGAEHESRSNNLIGNTISRYLWDDSIKEWRWNERVVIGKTVLEELAVNGSIKQSGPQTSTILYHGTNEAGIPTTDGFRMRYDDNFFGGDKDALVIEKTDGNHDVVDGGVAFVNTNQNGEVKTAMVIGGGGYVGIGTNGPSRSLHVIGDGLKIESSRYPGRYLDIQPDPAQHIDSTNDLYITTKSASGINFQTNGNNTRMIINSEGDVGIGKPDPGDKLTVLGGDIVLREIDDNYDAIRLVGGQSSGEINCYLGGDSTIKLRGNSGFTSHIMGDLGVGTKNPSKKLDVHGDLRVSGEIESNSELRIGGSSIIEGAQHVYGSAAVDGSMVVWGSFYCPSKSFIIDHPIKKNMYLVHGSYEGPEFGLIYRGHDQLKNGKAIVKLPAYFEKLTKKENRTVQLTCINGWSTIYVEGAVKENKFTVNLHGKEGNKNQEFDWQVMAVRNDTFLRSKDCDATDSKGDLIVEVKKNEKKLKNMKK